MKQKNKYVYHSHITEKKFREIIKCFVIDITADRVAKLTRINRNTVNKYLMRIRLRIVELCKDSSPLDGTVEADESYFGPKRVRGKRGRGAGGKTKVIGILKREDGKVYTEIIPDCSRSTLQKIISGKVDIKSIVNTDGWKAGACPHENGGWIGRYWLRQASQSNPQ